MLNVQLMVMLVYKVAHFLKQKIFGQNMVIFVRWVCYQWSYLGVMYVFASNFIICISSKQYTPERKLQYILGNFLPTHYRVENPGKCWLKFDA